MKKLLILLCALPYLAQAQSTADQTQPGYLTTVGCPGGASSCFVPYSASNPLPVTVEGGGGLVTWPTSGDAVISNGTNSPAGVAPVNGECIIGSGGSWVAGSCSGSGTSVTSITGDGFLIGNSSSTGAVTLTQANHTANSVTGALTATTLSDLTLPSCSTGASALKWTSGAGFGCNSSINAAELGGATFASPSAIGSTTPAAGTFSALTDTAITQAGQLWATAAGILENLPACQAVTASAGAATVNWATSPCATVTASGGGVTVTLSNPVSSGDYELNLCNDTTARTWTLPGNVKQSSAPAVASTCAFARYSYDGTNYQGQGTNETATILRGVERAAPSASTSNAFEMWFDSANHILTANENGSGSNSNTVIPASSATSNEFVTYIDATGTIHVAQPAFSNLSGSATCSQLPALTGDSTTSAGSCSTTTGKINGTSLAGLATGILKNTTSTGVPSIAVSDTDYQAPISLTTTGTSGAATFSGNTLNIPQYSGGSTSPGGSSTDVQYNSSSSFAGDGSFTYATPGAVTLGVGASHNGTLTLEDGGASGAGVTLQNLGATSAYNFNLPTTAGASGHPLLSGGGTSTSMTWGSLTGNTSTFATATGSFTGGDCLEINSSGNIVDAGGACTVGGGGGTVSSGTAGNLTYYSSTGTTVTGNTNANISNGDLTLGIANSVMGELTLEGNTSGALTITPQAAAGTPTWTAGTASGTPAVTASSPLSITTASGNITCATCATTSGGGALSASSPVVLTGNVISAASTVVQTNQGNTYSSGTQNFSSVVVNQGFITTTPTQTDFICNTTSTVGGYACTTNVGTTETAFNTVLATIPGASTTTTIDGTHTGIHFSILNDMNWGANAPQMIISACSSFSGGGSISNCANRTILWESNSNVQTAQLLSNNLICDIISGGSTINNATTMIAACTNRLLYGTNKSGVVTAVPSGSANWVIIASVLYGGAGPANDVMAILSVTDRRWLY